MPENIEKIRQRIQRLLRMAGDKGSPQEAAIALRRARKLADKYSLDLELDKDDQFVDDVWKSHMSELPPEPWISTLVTAAAMLNDCNCNVKQYRPSVDEKYFCFAFQGHKLDVDMCKWFVDYLVVTLDKLVPRGWPDHMTVNEIQSREDSGADKIQTGTDVSFFMINDTPYNSTDQEADFRNGFAMTVAARVKQMVAERERELNKKKSEDDPGTGLIVRKRALVEDKFGRLKYKSKDVREELADPFSLNAGMAAGQAVDLTRAALPKD